MEKEQLRNLAAKLVADGLKRAAVISGQAWQERRMAELLPRPEAADLRYSATAKFLKASRLRQLCGRLAAAHGISQKETGQGLRPRPVGDDVKPIVSVRRLSHAR